MPGALMLLVGLALAQEAPEIEWEPIAVVRPRFRSGYSEGLALGFLDDRAVTHRARLGLQMTRETVEARVVAQLSSGWERGPRQYRFVPAQADFYEGWGRLNAELPAKIKLSFTAGRIPITVHEGRLISEDEFSFRGQSVDGLHFTWSLGTFHQHVLTYRYPDPDPDRFRGAVANWIGFSDEGPVTAWTADLVTINDYLGLDPRATVGPHFRIDTGRFHVLSEIYSQTVVAETFGEATQTALFGSQTVGYTLGPERLVNLRGRFDAATGDFLGNGAGFDAPLGDSYRWFGHLGLFQSAQGAAGRGIADGALLVTVAPHARVELELDGHGFWFLDDGAVAGQEVDFTARYHVSPYARVELGAWAFVPTGSTRRAFSVGTDPTSAYLQFEIGSDGKTGL